MFEDQRGRKIVVLAHCILNQNTKLDRCAHCAGALGDVLGVLVDNGVGMLQMECPEMLHLGLDRQADVASQPSIADEDTRIARRMRETAARALVARIADSVVGQIVDYHAHGFAVLGIVGINGSPTCGVETNWYEDAEPPGAGLLTQAIAERLERAGVRVPMRGIRSKAPCLAEQTVRRLIEDA